MFDSSRFRVITSLIVGLVVVTSCTATPSGSPSPAGSAAAPSGQGSSTAPTAQGKQPFLLFVGEGPLSNPQWAAYDAGFEAGAKALGATAKYLGTPTSVGDINVLLQVIRDGIGMKPDGMIITDDRPGSEDAVIKEVTAAGIPVILFATGATSVEATGALGWVGRDYISAGNTGGRYLTSLGCKSPLIVALIKGQATYSDDAVTGVGQTFKGKITTTDIPSSMSSDSTAQAGIVKAALLKDTSIDCLLAVGGTLYAGMVAGQEGLGDRTNQLHAHSGLANASEAAFTDILNGTLAWAQNPQPYFTGWMAVSEMYAAVRWGMVPSRLMGIDDQIITKANAQKALNNLKQNGFY